MNRSFKMSNDVYAAMLARGFTGEIRSLHDVPDATAATGWRSRRRSRRGGRDRAAGRWCRDAAPAIVPPMPRPTTPRRPSRVFELRGVRYRLRRPPGRARRHRPARSERGRAGRPARRQRLGQVDAAQAAGRHHRADRGHDARARPRRRGRRRRARTPSASTARSGWCSRTRTSSCSAPRSSTTSPSARCSSACRRTRSGALRRGAGARWTSRTSPTARRSSSPVARRSARRSPRCCRCSPTCCCSTSRPRRSIRARSGCWST